MDHRALFCIYSPLPPLRGQPTVDYHPRWLWTIGWGDCRIRIRDCRFTVWCRYQWATVTPLPDDRAFSRWIEVARARSWTALVQDGPCWRGRDGQVGWCSDLAESQPAWSTHHWPQVRGRLGGQWGGGVSQPAWSTCSQSQEREGGMAVGGVELNPSRPGQPPSSPL